MMCGGISAGEKGEGETGEALQLPATGVEVLRREPPLEGYHQF